MRTLRILFLTSLMLVLAGTTLADTVLSSPNALGLYFDGEGASSDVTLGAPATIEAYLIFTEPTISFIIGWQTSVTISTGGSVVGTSYPVGTTALSDGPTDWSAVLSAPMPCNALTKLATFSIASDALQNTFIYLGNIANPAAPGDLPAVQLQDGSWSSVPLSSGDPSIPVAAINSSTPNETTSWGDVKSLFR